MDFNAKTKLRKEEYKYKAYMLTAITKVVGFNYYVPKECVYSALIVRLYMEVRLFQVRR